MRHERERHEIMAEKIGMIVALGRKMTDDETTIYGQVSWEGEEECGIIKFSLNPLSSSLEVFQNGENGVLTLCAF